MRAIALLILPALLVAGCAHSDEPWEGDFDAHYTEATADEGHALGYNDRIFAGEDGRFYCQRRNGSLGLAVMDDGSALPNNFIRPGQSVKLGMVVGSEGGAAVRHAIDARALTCR